MLLTISPSLADLNLPALTSVGVVGVDTDCRVVLSTVLFPMFIFFFHPIYELAETSVCFSSCSQSALVAGVLHRSASSIGRSLLFYYQVYPTELNVPVPNLSRIQLDFAEAYPVK